MANERQLTLLQRWAPLVYMHPDETYFPSAADWYLARTRLLDATGTVYSDSTGDYDPVINGTTRTNSSYLADKVLGQRLDFFLEIIDPATRAGDLDSASCYGYVSPVIDEHGNPVACDLNYWFFYPFNGNIFRIDTLIGYLAAAAFLTPWLFFIPVLGVVITTLAAGLSIPTIIKLIQASQGLMMHEGDWEGIKVRVSKDGSQIQQIRLNQHNKSEWFTEYQKTSDGRPIVYSAKSSHATYSSVGHHPRLLGLAPDETGKGRCWDTQARLVDVGYDANARQVMLWGPRPTSPYDGGLLWPVVAVNDEKVVAEVHPGVPGEYSYYYNLGKLDAEARSVTWWAGAHHGTRFDGGSGVPTVSINDELYLVSVHASGSKYWYNAGLIDPVGKTVDWWVPGQGTPFDDGNGGVSVAINNNNLVVSLHESDGKFFYNVGVIDPLNKIINWWNGGKGVSFISEQDLSDPYVALNDQGWVIEVHGSGVDTQYSLGIVDAENEKINWHLLQVYCNPGLPQSVAWNSEGTVVVTHTRQIKGGFSGSLTLGKIRTATANNVPFVDWSTPVWNRVFATAAITKEGTVVHVYPNSIRGGSYFVQVGSEILDSFDNWTPLNGQDWLKFSGHWGRKGTEPLLDIPDSEPISVFVDGPTGPAYK